MQMYQYNLYHTGNDYQIAINLTSE